MRRARPLASRRLGADSRGISVVEFGLVAPVLAMTVIGLFDLGYSMYVSSVLQGVLHDAARMATVGDITSEQINDKVRSELLIVAHDGQVRLDTTSYDNFSDVGKPEKITSDTAPVGEYNVGDCYEDANNNGHYDSDRGAAGLGDAEDIVNYTVTITYPRLLPVAGFFGWPADNVITGSTVLRNQPFAANAHSVVVRCN